MRDIRGSYASSGILARSFYGTSRRVGAPGAPAFRPELPEFEEEAAIVSLVAAGFQFLSDELSAGRELSEALERAGDSATRAGTRTALAGGRRMIVDATERDLAAVGFYWQTRGDDKVCSWCSMLASRGAVFKKDSWASDPRPDGRQKVSAHDNCRCHVTPLWSEQGDILPDDVVALSADWDDVRATGPGRLWTGDESVRAWRRYWEALQRGEDRAAALLRARDGSRTTTSAA